MRQHAVPGALLLILAGSQYGDTALAALTGWPLDWCYALLQAAGQTALWAMVAALVPRGIALVPGAAVCILGAFEGAQRAACIVAQMLRPVELSADTNLCEAHTGVALYAWGLAALSVTAVIIAAWATAHDKK